MFALFSPGKISFNNTVPTSVPLVLNNSSPRSGVSAEKYNKLSAETPSIKGSLGNELAPWVRKSFSKTGDWVYAILMYMQRANEKMRGFINKMISEVVPY